ncbi:glucoamylase family protein [Granulicella mallensis]|uniref:Glycoamylase-like domain-containing protein n=1 Tax=Granulicella mallensis (strain ATCC BAA-1857 / DSM 23137 / MP5ACTX8) TaxID=682795 RepID=G8NSG0_GRAMM|nr:glucoamylase family protein [Granulicella mallensis]AEU38536.1 Protein of unknown function DUF2329 [Granulicella mallensis MP5ACTX8]
MERRTLLKLLAGSALLPQIPAFARTKKPNNTLTQEDDAFLDEMQRRGCLYFVEQAGAKTGQVLDRAASANTDGKRDPRLMASIAATGFGLSALCIAEKRGYQPRQKVIEQIRRTLHFHYEQMPHEHGFLYHFNDVEYGAAYIGSEVSSIDTALLLCGVLTARAHFHEDAEIKRLATALYERVDWPWMLNGGTTFSMGFSRGKFIQSRWAHYSELMMIYLLAMGSPTHPVEASAWDAFDRPKITYKDYTYIGAGDPLFVHQYSHAWFDFRGKRDKYANYFDNSVIATKAHEAFCLSLGKPYSPDYWGISASDSEHGYTAWGGPPGEGHIDGSVVPNAPAGSLPFLPADCLRVLRSLKEKYGEKAWGRYGFCDAFHPEAKWYDPDVLGIDLGIGVLMSENLRTGFVWETFARNPEVGVAMKKAGFRAV